MTDPIRRALDLCRPAPSQLSRNSIDVILGLFGPIADWWLHRDVWSRIDPLWRPPSLPNTYGSCWIVIAQDTEETTYHSIEPAFLFPLQWQKSETRKHDERLPRAVHELADQVSRDFRLPEWSIHLHPCIETQQDLSNLDEFDIPSGWVALAGGLVVTMEGGRPNPSIWASGCWDWQQGILPIGHLESKLKLARRYNVSEFFVPESNRNEVVNDAEPPAVKVLKAAKVNPREALNEYLMALEAQPDKPNDEMEFQNCVRYFLPRFRHPRGESFYRSHLLPTIIEHRRKQIRSEFPNLEVSHLVTAVSGSPVLIEIAVQVFELTTALLFHTTDKEQVVQMEQTCQRLKQLRVECQPYPIANDASMLTEMQNGIAQLGPVAPEQIIHDITPGTKLMTYSVVRAAAEGSYLMYLENDSRTYPPKPGSERYLIWRVDRAD